MSLADPMAPVTNMVSSTHRQTLWATNGVNIYTGNKLYHQKSVDKSQRGSEKRRLYEISTVTGSVYTLLLLPHKQRWQVGIIS